MELLVPQLLFTVICLAVVGLWFEACRFWIPRIMEDSKAEKRANLLLREVLSESEIQEMDRSGYLEIESPSTQGRSYRIPVTGGRVIVYEAKKPLMLLCVEAADRLPRSDILLMHKLMIEGNEEEYLQTANIQQGASVSLLAPPRSRE